MTTTENPTVAPALAEFLALTGKEQRRQGAANIRRAERDGTPFATWEQMEAAGLIRPVVETL